jgi:hypothetical protein
MTFKVTTEPRWDGVTGLWLQYLGGDGNILEMAVVEDLTFYFDRILYSPTIEFLGELNVDVHQDGVSIHERTSHEKALTEGLWSEIIAEVVS